MPRKKKAPIDFKRDSSLAKSRLEELTRELLERSGGPVEEFGHLGKLLFQERSRTHGHPEGEQELKERLRYIDSIPIPSESKRVARKQFEARLQDLRSSASALSSAAALPVFLINSFQYFAGRTSGDNPKVLAPRRKGHDQKPGLVRHPDGLKPLFGLRMLLVITLDPVFIGKNRTGFLERDAVLSLVGPRLSGVPFKLHYADNYYRDVLIASKRIKPREQA